MPAVVCSRCQRVNPDYALFCFYDGAELRPPADGILRPSAHQLPQEFVFPSGRHCGTFDQLAQGCQEEWQAAGELLRQGAFRQFFTSISRHDLARAAQEAMSQADPDIGLTSFLASLPVTRTQQPRLDLNPRRLLLGTVLAGETRQVQVTVHNQGQGILQGTLRVSEGGQWLRLLGESDPGQCSLRTANQQSITLLVDTRGLPAGQSYGGKLTVISNGGVVEVPVRLDLISQGFAQAPFLGIKGPREMAEKMRAQPKAAGPLLENGEVARWFAANGWNYPVRGNQAQGVAGVQQFFEAMGLSRPPKVAVAPPEVRLHCRFPESVRGQVVLHASSRKWVYAAVATETPWLKVLTPFVTGPQQVAVAFEVLSQLLPPGAAAEGQLNIQANSGQVLTVPVRVEVRGAPKARLSRQLLAPVLALVMASVLVRLLLVPMIDLVGRGGAARAAATRIGQTPAADSPLRATGGWLQLPWPRILASGQPAVPIQAFDPNGKGMLPVQDAQNFRDYFVSYLLRAVILGTFWIGTILGGWLMWQRGGGGRDLAWGAVAGAVAGIVGSATLASVVLVVDLLPHTLWDLALGGSRTGLLGLGLWVLLVLTCWTIVAGLLGLLLNLLPAAKLAILAPLQSSLAWIFRQCGLRALAAFIAPG